MGLSDEDVDHLVDVLTAESQAIQPGGCCAHPEWRGHLCGYHEGYADGAEAMGRAVVKALGDLQSEAGT